MARLAQQLGLDPAVLAGYGQRARTRSDHVRLVANDLLGSDERDAGWDADEEYERVR